MGKSAIAKAYVQVVPSADGIKGQLSGIFGSEGTSAGAAFGSNLIGTVKNLIAAAGLGKLLSEALNAGGDLQQSLGGVETLFKDSADIVIANAEQAYKTAGMSANAYMETVTGFSASLLQGLSGDTETAAAIADMALTDMSDNANKMGTDMEAVQNAYQGFAKQNYTMLDNLKLGYGGTKTEMERLLTDAQKLTGVKYDIDNLADVYSAIHAIQEEMDITGTTAKEAASTFSGSLSSMKAAFSDLLAQMSLGTEDLTPYFDSLSETVFTFAAGNLLPMVGNVLKSLPSIISGGFSMAIRGMNLAANNAETIVQMGIELVTSIGSAVITAIPYLAEAGLNIVSSLGNVILNTDWAQVAQSTITELQTNLDLAAGEILGTDGNIVQSVLNAIASGLPSILEGGVGIVVEMANGLLEGLPDFLETGGELMGQLLDTVLAMLPDMLSSGVSLVGQLAEGLLGNLPSLLSSGASIIADLLATIASYLPDLFESGISLIGEMAVGLIAAIPDLVTSIPEIITNIVDTFMEWDWWQIGSDIISGIANGILSGVGAIISAAWSAAESALSAAKEALDIHSPSRRFRGEVGRQVSPAIALGIRDNADLVHEAVYDLSDEASRSLADGLRLNETNVTASDKSANYGDTVVTINVYASEGQDVDELAEILMQKIQSALARKEAALST